MRARRSSLPGAALLCGCLTVAPLSLLGCGSPPAAPRALAEQNARRVSWPARLGWVSSERPSGALPSAIALGGKASGRVLIYLEFAAPSELRRLLRADLVLVASGAPGESIEVELSRAEAARGQLAAWSDQPRARYPRLSARLASGALPGRLDVTELVRAESKPGEPLRLLLRAEPGASEPLLVETGAAGGAAPRLEVYWE
jgi:hypothetical protein